MKLTRDVWLRIEPLLTSALEMDAAARAVLLAEVDATQPDVAPVLRRMLEAHDRAERTRELETLRKPA